MYLFEPAFKNENDFLDYTYSLQKSLIKRLKSTNSHLKKLKNKNNITSGKLKIVSREIMQDIESIQHLIVASQKNLEKQTEKNERKVQGLEVSELRISLKGVLDMYLSRIQIMLEDIENFEEKIKTVKTRVTQKELYKFLAKSETQKIIESTLGNFSLMILYFNDFNKMQKKYYSNKYMNNLVKNKGDRFLNFLDKIEKLLLSFGMLFFWLIGYELYDISLHDSSGQDVNTFLDFLYAKNGNPRPVPVQDLSQTPIPIGIPYELEIFGGFFIFILSLKYLPVLRTIQMDIFENVRSKYIKKYIEQKSF